MVAGGIVLTTLGAGHVGLGIVAIAADESAFVGLGFVVGIPSIVLGTGLLAGGIPMIVIGAKSVPDTSQRAVLSFVPQMGGGALRLTF